MKEQEKDIKENSIEETNKLETESSNKADLSL